MDAAAICSIMEDLAAVVMLTMITANTTAIRIVRALAVEVVMACGNNFLMTAACQSASH